MSEQDTRAAVESSRAYQSRLAHRRRCYDWARGMPCAQCGLGLTAFGSELLREVVPERIAILEGKVKKLRAERAMYLDAANRAMSERAKERERLEARVKDLEARLAVKVNRVVRDMALEDLLQWKARAEAAEKENREMREEVNRWASAPSNDKALVEDIADLKAKLAEVTMWLTTAEMKLKVEEQTRSLLEAKLAEAEELLVERDLLAHGGYRDDAIRKMRIDLARRAQEDKA